MSKRPRILFICHAASRNGATILLLNTLRWLRARDEFDIEVLIHGGGELVGEFESVCRTTVFRNPANLLEGFPVGFRTRWMPRVERWAMQWKSLGRRWDLVYANTASIWPHIPVLLPRAEKLLWHIHELGYALRLAVGEERARELFGQTSRVIAVSECVRATLESDFGVRPDRMDVINGSVPLPGFTFEKKAAARKKVLAQLGWPEDSFVVGACGAMGWRKGTDVFLQVARETFGMNPDSNVRFLWVGGAAKGDEALRFKQEARLFGVGDRCRSIPTTGDVNDYYMSMDVFALTSREDPYPLVMLEAGACHVPTVCFAGGGGGEEFVGTDAGLIAPYLDVKAFTASILALRGSPEFCAKLGAAAAEKVRSRHVVETQGPKILESIKRCLAEK